MQFHCKKNSELCKCIFGTSPQPGQTGLVLSRAWFWARGGVLKKTYFKPYYTHLKVMKIVCFCL